MRILIIGLNYLPESTSIGPYTADLAEHLAGSGHQVQVITGFPAAPQWRIWDGYRGRSFMREVINGIPVRRTYLYVPRKPGKALQRILFDTSFCISSFVGGLLAGKCDLIVVVSPPLQLGVTGWLLAKLRRCPLFFHIKDLVPDAATAVGVLKEGTFPVRAARALERFIYKRSKGIGVICDGFKRNLTGKGVPPEKVVILPDYINFAFMKPYPRDNAFRQRHSVGQDQFVAMYSGSIGRKQGLETFVESATHFKPGEGVVLYLVGEGPCLDSLKEHAQRSNAASLRFLPMQLRETLPEQLSSADVLVITQKKSITDVVFPGKLLYYMAAARPIIAAVSAESETGRFITANHVGLVVPPEEPAALAEAVRRLRQNPAEGEALGCNGRKTVERQFDRHVVLERFQQHLESMASHDT